MFNANILLEIDICLQRSVDFVYGLLYRTSFFLSVCFINKVYTLSFLFFAYVVLL